MAALGVDLLSYASGCGEMCILKHVSGGAMGRDFHGRIRIDVVGRLPASVTKVSSVTPIALPPSTHQPQIWLDELIRPIQFSTLMKLTHRNRVWPCGLEESYSKGCSTTKFGKCL